MKILLLALDGKLGDAIINSAFASIAQTLDGKLDLHVLASDGAFRYWKGTKFSANVWNINTKSLANTLSLAAKLNRQKFDYVITFREGFKSEKTRLLLKLINPRQQTIYCMNDGPENPQHVVHKSLSAINQIYQIAVDSSAATYIRPQFEDNLYGDFPKSFILLNPFAADNNPNRSLSQQETIALAQAITNLTGDFPIKIITTPGSVDLATSWLSGLPSQVSTINTHNDMDCLFWLCDNARVIVTVDTALTHIASAFNKPLAAIYPKLRWQNSAWAPRLCPHRIIQSANAANLRGFDVQAVGRAVVDLLGVDAVNASDARHNLAIPP